MSAWARPPIKAYVCHVGDPSKGRLVFAKYAQRAKGIFFRAVRCRWEDTEADRIPCLDHLAKKEGFYDEKKGTKKKTDWGGLP